MAGLHGGVTCEVCKSKLKDCTIIAEEKFYHPDCFRCYHCKSPLSTEYLVDPKGEFYCQSCYGKVFIICSACKETLCNKETVRIMEHRYHKECAKCALCKQRFVTDQSTCYYDFKGEPYCLRCCYNQITTTTSAFSSMTASVATETQAHSVIASHAQ